MAFSVSDPDGYEWSSDPWGLFAWKRNALDKAFRGMVGEIIDFNNSARTELSRDMVADVHSATGSTRMAIRNFFGTRTCCR